MPTHYVELDSEEMSYIEGGDYYINNNTCNAIMGTAFAGIYIDGVTLATAIGRGVNIEDLESGYKNSYECSSLLKELKNETN